MLAILLVLPKLLQLGKGVTIDVEESYLIVEPNPRPRYTMAELLAASDYSESPSPEEREWIDAPAVGGELL